MKKWMWTLLLILWAALALTAWLKPAEEISLTERRSLAQMPALSAQTVAEGSFMEDFESYALDQFPARDAFRSLKAVVNYYLMGQKDNNGIYLAEDQVAELIYPLDQASVTHALAQFQLVYDLHLQDAGSIYAAVIPDKGYYLAEENGYPVMDHEALFAMVQESLPWAEYVDITHSLSAEDYYRTDTHWRQECLLETARVLAEAMGVTVGQYTPVAVEKPFYGVYYGQAALPLEPDRLYLMENETLKACRVFNYTENTTASVYDLTKLEGNDLYEVFLSGAQSLLRIENPNAATDRELVLFRDSYASALAPLLTEDYAAITLVDIRYIMPQLLDRYVDFTDCDVLFLYSSLVLNKKLI